MVKKVIAGAIKQAIKGVSKGRPALAGSGRRLMKRQITPQQLEKLSPEQKLLREFYGLLPSVRRAEKSKGSKSKYYKALTLEKDRKWMTPKAVEESIRSKPTGRKKPRGTTKYEEALRAFKKKYYVKPTNGRKKPRGKPSKK